MGRAMESAEHLPARRTERKLEEKFAAREEAWRRRPAILETVHRVVCGDAREFPGLPSEPFAHLVVTSPPYWNLKPYHHDRGGAQLGHIAERQQFLDELARVWKRCYAALVPGGRLCVVVGDVCRSRRAHGRHRVDPLHAYILVQCQELGFDPLAPILWYKIANMATEVAGGAGFLGKPYEPNAIIKNDVEYILLFRKPGGYRHPTQEQRDLSIIPKDDYRRWFQQVWTDVTGEPQKAHPAPFPVEVARRLVGMFSFVGDTVLDPFWGVGNTTKAAMQLSRSSVGIEVEPVYIQRARKEFSNHLFGQSVEFVFPQSKEEPA